MVLSALLSLYLSLAASVHGSDATIILTEAAHAAVQQQVPQVRVCKHAAMSTICAVFYGLGLDGSLNGGCSQEANSNAKAATGHWHPRKSMSTDVYCSSA